MRRAALDDLGSPISELERVARVAFDRASIPLEVIPPELAENTASESMAFDRGASARTRDIYGRLHVEGCRLTKANVSPYYGREIPDYKRLNLDPNKIYRLYRHPEELKKAVPSFRNLQLLMLHAKVKADDPKPALTVGTVGSGISFDGKYMVTDRLTVWAREGINSVESEEARELSSSYSYRADMTPGVSPEGVAFDGVMRDIRGNHVALVPEGRVGSDVLVNDALPLELHTMKRPHLFARLLALGVIEPRVYEKEELVALDAKLESMTAKDSTPMEDEDMEDDPENPGTKRKKMNPGKGKAAKAGGALASDEQITEAVDAALKSKGYVSREDAQTMANDAAIKASADAVEKVNLLHTAREAVKPLVGVVAMDSAEAVYKFALEHEKVALDGVPAAAYPALVRERVAARSAAPALRSTTIAADAANAAAAAIPGLGRIQVG